MHHITTVYDVPLVPYTSAYMDASDGNIMNVTVQQQCPLRVSATAQLAFDGAVYDGIAMPSRAGQGGVNCLAL